MLSQASSGRCPPQAAACHRPEFTLARGAHAGRANASACAPRWQTRSTTNSSPSSLTDRSPALVPPAGGTRVVLPAAPELLRHSNHLALMPRAGGVVQMIGVA